MILFNFNLFSRLYKPFARKPWLTVYRAHTGVAFDSRLDSHGRQVGWGRALLEMLVAPVLSVWVPAWVAEQYVRWNPFVHAAVDIVSTPVADRRAGRVYRSFPVAEANQQLLRRSMRLMQLLLERRDKAEKRDAASRRGAGHRRR